jgi:GT2 family glycosyltransferase
LKAGDRLSSNALPTYTDAIGQWPDASLIYADDDLLSLSGERIDPHFKPDWNPELFEHHDYITGAAIIRVTRHALSDLPAERWAETLVRNTVARGGTPLHIQCILHHRRERPAPSIPKKPSKILPNPTPSVTAIIPTRNKIELLRACIEGVKRTAYPHVEILVVDNDSDDPKTLHYLEMLEAEGIKVLRIAGPFNFSALNNAAVADATGEMLCFLNNDVEIIDPDWLALLVREAVRPDIGAVGARLLYPDRSVQHAGVFTGIGGGAGHAHRYLRDDEPGYFYRAYLPQRVSAVTGACLVVARAKFLAVDGFDEESFPVAFNDVDLCLKLNSRGWQAFYEPRAVLIHHESKSRGSDSATANRARFAGELAALKRKWHTDEHRDPFHHPHLSPFCEQFLIAV